MISVIIPVYNVEKHLNKCIQSIVSQSYSDWECILIDDGSTDKSGEICDYWAAADTRITAIHQHNQGVSVARNNGLKLAKGEYINFVDSDDWVCEHYLENLYNQVVSDKSNIAVSGLINYYPNGTTQASHLAKTGKYSLDAAGSEAFIANIGFLYGPVAKLYNSDLIRQYGLTFPENLSLGEDMVFNFNYLSHIQSISFSAHADYCYCREEGTLSTKKRRHLSLIFAQLWKVRIDFVRQKELWCDEAETYFGARMWGDIYDCILGKSAPTYADIKHLISNADMALLRKTGTNFIAPKWFKCLVLKKQALLLYLISLVL